MRCSLLALSDRGSAFLEKYGWESSSSLGSFAPQVTEEGVFPRQTHRSGVSGPKPCSV